MAHRLGSASDEAACPPARRRLLIAAFLVSRALILLIVFQPEWFPHGTTVAADRDLLYGRWAHEVLDEGATPYTETNIEYPPAALPFLIGPGLVGTTLESYRLGFALMTGLVDVLGFVACLRIARRFGRPTAAWLWIASVGVLGPIAYARFDLVPAAMTAWSIERAAHDRWPSSAAWMAAAGAVKVYAILLLPVIVVASPNRRRALLASIAVILVTAVPFVTMSGELLHDVAGYHLTRGIHVESIWGSLLFIATRQGLTSEVGFGAGALHFLGGPANTLRPAAQVLVALVAIGGAWLATRVPRGDARSLAPLLLGVLCLTMVAAPVLSPQFILWVVPFGVAAVAVTGRGWISWVIVGIAIASVAVFPFLYGELTAATPLPVILLWGRNLGLLALGVAVLSSAWPRPGASQREPEQIRGVGIEEMG